jgi:phage gp36-like protein
MALHYSTTAQLIARYADDEEAAWATDNESTGTADTAVMTEALETAEAELDSYLAKRYAVPVDVASDDGLARILRGRTLDVAQYILAVRHQHVSDSTVKAYDDAVAWLTNVSKGVVVLPAAGTPASTVSREPTAKWGSGTEARSSTVRIFTRDEVSGL